MPTIVLAPDSFKGTLTAAQVCQILTEALRARFPEAEIHAIPMADGGEGMSAAYLALFGGRSITRTVCGPNGQPVQASYALLPDGAAVIEMAAAAGLPLAAWPRDVLHATTFGVGELLLDAEARGAKTVLLGLGGSATNDCGIGMAAALGFTFTDAAGRPVEPYAAHLGRIAAIHPPARLPSFALQAACDVRSPLTGPLGATRVFGPQKGADGQTVARLEEALCAFAPVLEGYCGFPAASMPGAGAAGGMGAAAAALLGGTLTPGAELLLHRAGFDELLSKADLVITGEGRLDGQSRLGKVPFTVASRCKRANVPCYALCGALGPEAEALYAHGITAMFAASRGERDLALLRKAAASELKSLAERVFSQPDFPIKP